jgi:hypothetical protein
VEGNRAHLEREAGDGEEDRHRQERRRAVQADVHGDVGQQRGAARLPKTIDMP